MAAAKPRTKSAKPGEPQQPAHDRQRKERDIADHGVIGNLATIALVACDGAIDYMCWPNLDSPSIFAGILDADQGGVFELAPDIAEPRVVQMYIPDTNVLLTRWMGSDASAELTDLMIDTSETGEAPTRLVRRMVVTRGTVTIHVRCAPRYDYARLKPSVTIKDGAALFKATDCPSLRLSGADFSKGDGEVRASITLKAGQCITLMLDEPGEPLIDADQIGQLIEATINRWRAWSAQSTYQGRWRDAVGRSALVLKLLTSRRHGSISAAGTFSLPEAAGGVRNWDYRAAWIRDSSFSIYALMRLGYHTEAKDFYRWLGDRAMHSSKGGELKVMYALDGGTVPAETSLKHLGGYGGAVPVRIGNDAVTQLQLDIYGELMDSIYLSNKYGEAISHDRWLGVCRVIDYVARHWKEPDAGIWEIRGPARHHLHSRLMCWVAMDRAIRLASKRSLAAPFTRWIKVRNAIHDDIWKNFWDEKLGHFVEERGRKDLDASMLLMPLVRFVGATDPRWLATLDAIGNKLTDDGMVYRYKRDDGLPGKEGAFSACSFWYVECLARAGRMDEARHIFEKLLRYANHVQLYAEEFDERAHLVGNFPQGFTHLALVSAAFYIDREMEGRGPRDWPA
ncbi:GH15 family glucan-1,4-alpha-glucosidase [Duganella sp. 3397]|uniref:glycoside hydrolase family 15 protein n=1 Tax=Duganella sp. 3397 TaxID=2817732 RepID=UPI002857E9ED|nr:glycoside hydrolase family 15 protein [Duganella sp. 3397]MDR7049230.1 GH15 family glucan-1,4-alpha-glucosidase [Duganella sp. 3397]